MPLRPTALCCLVSATLAAADVPSDPTTAAVTGDTPVAELVAHLPHVGSLVERDGGLWWQEGGSSLRVVGMRDDGALVATDGGRLPVTRAVLERDDAGEALAAAPKLVAIARRAGLALEDLRLDVGLITGPHLRSSDVLVLPEGVARRVEPEKRDRDADRRKVHDAAEAVRAAAGGTLGDLGRQVLGESLGRLERVDDVTDPEELDPSFARRQVRGGWLSRTLPASDAVTALESAVRDAETFAPVTSFAGDGITVAEVRDAFGHGGWILRTPSRSLRLTPHHRPEFAGRTWPELQVAVELSPGSDPLDPASTPTAARLYQGRKPIARWSAADGLTTDHEAWQAIAHGPEGAKSPLAGMLPPHLLITAMDGDPLLLATAHGVLAAPRAEMGERFLDEAAKALPDAPHLDLIGEHLHAYVFDSPETDHPLLIGTKVVNGDIHQTSAQTMAAASGGMIRGDCDDLAELYHDIAERQGRIAYVIHLPGHAAAAWAEKRDDGWHTMVLQTGDPHEFVASDLRASVDHAYALFNGVGLNGDRASIALRFAGENTRSTWILGWRIFAEPAYAATMIDVERDWYYHTHRRGIEAVRKLIDGGDEDFANHDEIAGLYRRTGEWKLAAAEKRLAVDHLPAGEAAAREEHELELLPLLQAAKDLEEAGKLAEAIAARLPAAGKPGDLSRARKALSLAGQLDDQHKDLRRRLVAMAYDDVQPLTAMVENWMQTRFDARAWQHDQTLRDYLGVSWALAGQVLGLAKTAGADGLRDDAQLREWVGTTHRWIDRIGSVQGDGSAPWGVITLAAHEYRDALGADPFQALVDQAPDLADNARTIYPRLGGPAQMWADLPWIKASVSYHVEVFTTDLWSQKAESFDPAKVLHHLPALIAAHQAAREHHRDSVGDERSVASCKLIAAVIGRDHAAARESLAAVRRVDDRSTYESTADLIGNLARFVPPDEFAQVMAIWRETVDAKPYYFAIAWTAVVGRHADEQALIAARAAVERFPDDPAFAEELGYLREVLAARTKDREAEKTEPPATGQRVEP